MAARKGPKPSVSDRERLRAVVVDKCAFGKSVPTVARLKGWADALSTVELELWVPEPVAWEIAEHVEREYAAAHSEYRSARRALADCGLDMPEWPTVGDRDDRLHKVLVAIRKSHANVKVLPLDAKDGLQALKDQVLLRPPAVRRGGNESESGADAKQHDEIKRGVKTGGSDIASVRLVHRHEPDSSRYIVLGRDKDWQRCFVENGWTEPQFFDEWKELRPQVFSLVSAVGVGPALIEGLSNHLMHDAASFLGSVIGAGTFAEDDDDVSGVVARNVDVDIVTGIAGVRGADRVEGNREIHATMVITADVLVTVQQIDPYTEEWSSDLWPYPGAVLQGGIVARLEDDVVVDVIADSNEPFEVVPVRGYADPDDALQGVLSCLRAVPGMEDEEWLELGDTGSWSGELANGMPIRLTLDASSDGWKLDVDDGEDKHVAHLRCEYDPSSWVGGMNGFHREPPWQVLGEDGLPSNAAWEVAASLIAGAGWISQR